MLTVLHMPGYATRGKSVKKDNGDHYTQELPTIWSQRVINYNNQAKMLNDAKFQGVRPSQTDKVCHFPIRFLKNELKHRADKVKLNLKGTKS